MVEVFDGLQLEGHGAVVAGLVAGFDVQIDEVVAAGGSGRIGAQQGIDGGLSLAFEVGVVKTRSARNVDDPKTGITPDAPDEVNGGDDRAVAYLGETLGEWYHLRTVAAAPRPDARSHVFSFACAFLI